MTQKYLWELTPQQKDEIAALVKQEIAKECAKVMAYKRVADYLGASPLPAKTVAGPFVEQIAEAVENEWRDFQASRQRELAAR